MKLSTKLIASFSGVIILLLLIGLSSRYFYKEIQHQVVEESRGAIQELEVSGKIESYLHQSFINAQYYLNVPNRKNIDENVQDSLISMAQVKRKVRISMHGLNLNLKKAQRLTAGRSDILMISSRQDSSDKAIIAKLVQGIKVYNSLMNQLLNINDRNFKDTYYLLNVTIEPHFRNNLLPLVDRYRRQIRTNLDKQVGRLNRRLRRFRYILVGATIFAFLVSLLLAYILYYSIATPIYALADAAQEIGRGNLNKRIDIMTNDEIGQLGRAFNKMTENLSNITFSKAYVDDIIDTMRDSLIVTDKTFHITKVNAGTLNMLGLRKDEIIGESIAKIIADSPDALMLGVYEESSFQNYETQLLKKDHQSIPVNLSKAILRDAGGDIQSLVYVATDISERKKSERIIKASLKEKETLLAEIHHRVKNNLAVISGLLQMQRWETGNEVAQQVLQDSQLRVKSIALVHEKLYQSDKLSDIEFDKYMQELINEINRTFKDSSTDIEFDVQIEPLMLSVNQAIPCSLLLNELIVNIHKHAFEGMKKGRVLIKLCKQAEKVHLIVKDTGKGLNKKEEKGGSLGMSLIDTLVKQLNGQLKSYNDDGATFEIIFNLDEI